MSDPRDGTRMTVLTIQYNDEAWAPEVAGRLVDESGKVLYSHVSSSKQWLEADLTGNFGRSTELADRYPDGFTVEWQPIASAGHEVHPFFAKIKDGAPLDASTLLDRAEVALAEVRDLAETMGNLGYPNGDDDDPDDPMALVLLMVRSGMSVVRQFGGNS